MGQLTTQDEAMLNCIPVPTNMDKLQLQNFQQELNKEPQENMLVKSADGKAKTLSISAIEMQLDRFFFGQWDLTNIQIQQIFNEITGTGELVCVHPISGREIKRSGFASVVITQDAGAPVTDFNSTKKKNALDMAFPKLKAEILKNAAQSLGKAFGRDLNRKAETVANYSPKVVPMTEAVMEQVIKTIEAGKATKESAMIKLNQAYSMTEDQINQIQNYQPKQLQA